jgi:hypothetical protein
MEDYEKQRQERKAVSQQFDKEMEFDRLLYINGKFNKELDQQINGTLTYKHVYQLGNAREILQAAGILNLPIELSAKHLALKAGSDYKNKHPFDISAVKNLPNAIQNPIAIFDSTKKDGSKVILTELQHNNDNFIAILRVRQSDKFRKINIEVNDIRSIYPKDRKESILNWINGTDNLLKWVNKEKTLRFFSTQWPNYIGGGEKAQGIIINANLQQKIKNAIIKIKNFENPIIMKKEYPQIGEICYLRDNAAEHFNDKPTRYKVVDIYGTLIRVERNEAPSIGFEKSVRLQDFHQYKAQAERYFTNSKNNTTMEQEIKKNNEQGGDYTIAAAKDGKTTTIAEVSHKDINPQQQPEKNSVAQENAIPKNTTSKGQNTRGKKNFPTTSVNEEIDPVTNFVNNFAQNARSTQERKPPISEDQLGTVKEQLKNIGVDIGKLQENGDLNKMLYYGKSGLVNIYLNTGDGTNTKARTQGKLSIIKDANGDYQLKTYPQRALNIDKYFSHEFTETQKENLMKHGNAGEVLSVSFGEGQDPKKVLVSLDRDTNNLHSHDIGKIHLPEKYFGAEITPEMKAQILEGKSVEVKGMISPKNPDNTFDGKVMYNAGEKKLAIVEFDKHQVREVTKIGNVQLTQEQIKSFAAGEGIHLKGFQRKGHDSVSDLFVQRDKDGSFKFDKSNPNPAKEPEKNIKRGEETARQLSKPTLKNQTVQQQVKAPKVPKGKGIKPGI